jgi:small subunit ribosomal protein S21
MPHVKVRDGETFERAFRRFIKACEKCGLMAEVRKHQRFMKPSEARKRKSAAARRKVRKLIRLQQIISGS